MFNINDIFLHVQSHTRHYIFTAYTVDFADTELGFELRLNLIDLEFILFNDQDKPHRPCQAVTA